MLADTCQPARDSAVSNVLAFEQCEQRVYRYLTPGLLLSSYGCFSLFVLSFSLSKRGCGASAHHEYDPGYSSSQVYNVMYSGLTATWH